MLGEGGTPLSRLQAAVREFLARDERDVDLSEYRAVIDSLDCDFSSVAREAQKSGAHLVGGNITAASWIARTCDMSINSAADRLCVGEQLESLPKVAAALAAGEVGYQSVSILCHLRDVLAEQRRLFDEDEMLGFARQYSVFELRQICNFARHIADPDGCFNEAEENFTRRRMHVSQLPDGMYKVDGLLDPISGAALKTAAESLAKRLGPDDERSHKQRLADATGGLANQAMDKGTLPSRHSVRPHINLTTTLEGLKKELGAAP